MKLPLEYSIRHFLTTLLVLLSVSACSSSDEHSPEEKIRALLSDIEEQVETRSLNGVMQHISEQYQDHQGKTKKDVARLMQFQIIRNHNINLFTYIRSIEITDNIAAVELSAAMAANESDLSLESNRLRADTAQFSILLNKSDDRWLIESASWKEGW